MTAFRVFVFSLQRKIRIVIFFKILGHGLGGNPLQRIVAKTAAVMPGGNDAALLTDDSIIIDFSAKAAVCTQPLDLFPEQHGIPPFLQLL